MKHPAKRRKRKVVVVKAAPVIAEPIPVEIIEKLPEPVRVLVEALNAGEVEEIILAEHAEPTRLERIKRWFAARW